MLQSIVYAPEVSKDKELALAHGNRSAVLLQLSHYEDCLQDISYAIFSDFPEPLCYKLYYRKAECLHALKKFEDARTALDITKSKMNVSEFKSNTDRGKHCIHLSIGSCIYSDFTRVDY